MKLFLFLILICSIVCIAQAIVKDEAKVINALNEAESLASDINANKIQYVNNLNGGTQSITQVSDKNLLDAEGLRLHNSVVNRFISLPFQMFNETWRFSDLCYKPAKPVNSSDEGSLVKSLLDSITPCAIVSPLSCFWDGAKALGPHPPLYIDLGVSILVPSLPSGKLTWSNINPSQVIEDVQLIFPVNNIASLFKRIGIGSGFMDRPCIDPLDVGCPLTSPNYYNMCWAVDMFIDWNMKRDEPIDLNDFRPSGTSPLPLLNQTSNEEPLMLSSGDTYTDDYYENNGFGTPKQNPFTNCQVYAASVRNLMRKRPDLSNQFIPLPLRPPSINYAKILTDGCPGLPRALVQFEEDNILSGITRKQGEIREANGLQSSLLLATPQDIYERFKDWDGAKSKLDLNTWSESKAEKLVNMWRDVIRGVNIAKKGSRFVTFYYPQKLNHAFSSFFSV